MISRLSYNPYQPTSRQGHCLASEEGVELGEMLRGGASDVQLLEAIRAAVRSKPLQHPFHPWDCLDIPVTRYMYRIGG